MKIGDRVMVDVGPCKDRGGVVNSIKGEQIEVKFDMGPFAYYKKTSLKYYSKENLPIGVTDTPVKEELKEATKYDGDKVRMELIPVSGLEGIGRAMTYGSRKYDDHNWAKGFDWLRLVGSAMRHLTRFVAGEDVDPESGLSHLDHFGACAVLLIAHKEEGLGHDNRRKTN